MPSEHLSASAIAGYLDGDLTTVERQAAEAHLDACASCRAELTAVGRLAHQWGVASADVDRGSASAPAARRPHRRWPRAAALGVLAAGLAGVLVARRAPDPAGLPRGAEVAGAVERGMGQPTPAPAPSGGIVAVAPGDTVAATSARFVWRPGRADVYRLTLLAEDGAPIWSGETIDTTLTLPGDVLLRAGARYFWHVDGIADGIVVSTGERLLHVRP